MRKKISCSFSPWKKSLPLVVVQSEDSVVVPLTCWSGSAQSSTVNIASSGKGVKKTYTKTTFLSVDENRFEFTKNHTGIMQDACVCYFLSLHFVLLFYIVFLRGL